MSKKEKVDLGVALVLIVIGLVLFVLPSLGITNVPLIMLDVMSVYGILNFIQFMCTKESKDYEGLFTSFLSFGVGLIGYFCHLFSSTANFVSMLFAWIILMAIIKLKKTDYYNDRKNKMWIVRVFTLLLFIMTGLVVAANLNHSPNIQLLVLGFFFFIHGILELVDPLANYMMEK